MSRRSPIAIWCSAISAKIISSAARCGSTARAARAAIAEHVARPLGIDVVDAAEGIVRIINVKMQEAIKAISTMRGHDLRDFQLLAFGGAGPLHAGRIAEDLGMAGIVVPLYPGVYSAMGLLMSDVKHDYIRSRLSALDKLTTGDINAVFAAQARQAEAELLAEGFSREEIASNRRSTCAMPARATK